MTIEKSFGETLPPTPENLDETRQYPIMEEGMKLGHFAFLGRDSQGACSFAVLNLKNRRITTVTVPAAQIDDYVTFIIAALKK